MFIFANYSFLQISSIVDFLAALPILLVYASPVQVFHNGLGCCIYICTNFYNILECLTHTNFASLQSPHGNIKILLLVLIGSILSALIIKFYTYHVVSAHGLLHSVHTKCNYYVLENSHKIIRIITIVNTKKVDDWYVQCTGDIQ